MSHIAQYLLAQAAQRPLQTVQFAAAELWRRGRMRWVNSIERNLPTFADAAAPSRFAPFLASRVVDGFAGHFPAAIERIRAAADAICRHEFTLLNSQYRAGLRIDWHADWVTGHRWPCVPPAQSDFMGAPAGSDVKRPWELARFHHALPLGQAFALCGENKYASEFAAQVQDWIRENPYPCGIHWAMPMEIGIRAANLCTAGAFFASAKEHHPDFWPQFFTTLFMHGRYLALHREWNPVARGNHYLGCLVGLLHTGALFRHMEEGQRWFAEAKAALATEVDWQVGKDGVAHEGSSNYHGLVAEMFTSAALLAARAEHPVEFAQQPLRALQITWGQRFCMQLEKMFLFPAALLEGRAAPPVLGDSDDGQLLPLCSHSTLHGLQHLVALGQAIFGNAAGEAAGHRCEQAWWLAGDARPAARPVQVPAAFEQSGFYFLSSPRLRGSVRCGPLGVRGWANHAHCDQLHVEFALDGAPVLVDPGTYAYSADSEARNQFRSSRFHNSPVVNGAEQNRFWPGLLFRMMDDANCKIAHWAQGEGETRFAGIHSGYARLPQRVQVQREVTLNRTKHSLWICDTLIGEGQSQIEWSWQFAPGLTLQQKQTVDAACSPAPEHFVLHSEWMAGPVLMRAWFLATAGAAKATVFDGWFAPRYGMREAAPGLRFMCAAALPVKAIFEFFPRSTQGGEPR